MLGWLLATDREQNAYAMARRLGVMYLIWNNRIWSTSRADQGWRPYSDCAGHPERSADSRCHRDHLHISLSWEGARGVTSYWTGRVARADFGPCRVVGLNWAAPYSGFNPRPCTRYPTVTAPAGASPTLRTLTTYSGRVLQEGTTGVAVKSLQKVVGVTATGTFGPATKRALQRWQADHGLTRTGDRRAGHLAALLRPQAPRGSRLDSAACPWTSSTCCRTVRSTTWRSGRPSASCTPRWPPVTDPTRCSCWSTPASTPPASGPSRRSARWTAPRWSTSTAAARSPGMARDSWSATPSCGCPTRSGGGLRPPAGGGHHRHARRLRPGHRPGPRPVRGVAGRRRGPAGAQDRRDRRTGRRGDHDARLRDQRRPRPGRFDDDHPVRPGRGRGHLDGRRARPSRSMSPRWPPPCVPSWTDCCPSPRMPSRPTSPRPPS